MDKTTTYIIGYGISGILYIIWLARFTKRVSFARFLMIATCAVGISAFLVLVSGSRFVNMGGMLLNIMQYAGTVVLVLIGGFFACLPVILIEIVRGIFLWIRMWRERRESSTNIHDDKVKESSRPKTKTEQAGGCDGEKHGS